MSVTCCHLAASPRASMDFGLLVESMAKDVSFAQLARLLSVSLAMLVVLQQIPTGVLRLFYGMGLAFLPNTMGKDPLLSAQLRGPLPLESCRQQSSREMVAAVLLLLLQQKQHVVLLWVAMDPGTMAMALTPSHPYQGLANSARHHLVALTKADPPHAGAGWSSVQIRCSFLARAGLHRHPKGMHPAPRSLNGIFCVLLQNAHDAAGPQGAAVAAQLPQGCSPSRTSPHYRTCHPRREARLPSDPALKDARAAPHHNGH
mmetsp:Transcript_52194/g.117560  ORF Transcript_52194/g.117560 Transcript_52194/m.117560 type:complete len:259 (-) Transcript_52194:212-988(-)